MDPLLFMAGTGSEEHFAAKDRLHAGGLARFVKFYGSVEVAKIGQRQRFHFVLGAQAASPLTEAVDSKMEY